MNVLCWDCPGTFDIPSDMESQAFKAGRIRRRVEGDSDSPWIGLCERCVKIHELAAKPAEESPRKRPLGFIEQLQGDTRQILHYARQLCENDLTLSLEDAIHQAVDLLFAPEREPNQAFRDFLIARATATAA